MNKIPFLFIVILVCISITLNAQQQENLTFEIINNNKPILDDRALFSDGTNGYRRPSEPNVNQPVKVRLRTKKDNVEKIQIWWKSIKDNEKREKTAKTIQHRWKIEKWYMNQTKENKKLNHEKYIKK